jgi:hypothetical protein
MGSKNQSVGPWEAFVSSIAVLTNVVTLAVSTQSGNIPAVGDLVSVIGTPIAAANVTNVALASVTIDANTGIGTITYAATTPDVGTSPCGGQAAAKVPEVAEPAVASQAGQAFAVPKSSRLNPNGRQISLSVSYPSAPGAIKYNLQAAIYNVDSEYASLGTDLTAAGTTFFTLAEVYNFVRYKDTGSTGGTNPTVIAKLLI